LQEIPLIESESIAEEISKLMLEFGARLDVSVELVRDNCSPEELRLYRRAVGEVMGVMLLDIMNPLYARHPSLKPPQLR
jgi:phytoene/squalene synthetase